MLEHKTILLISLPLIGMGFIGLLFCFLRDFNNINKGRGRSNNTAPEIYWFMMVLIIVGIFMAMEWKWALLSCLIIILSLHPIRKKTKLREEN